MKLCTIIDGKNVFLDATPNFKQSYDLIVCGVGTSGAIAALCAAEKGLKVLAAERLNAVGGASTTGGICKYYLGSDGGRFEGIDKKLDELNGKVFAHADFEYGPAKELMLEREIKTAGGELKFEIFATGVWMDDNRVCGLRMFENGIQIDISAKFVIDATGEAEICRLAGCKTRRGREFDLQTQPYTNTNLFVNKKGQIYGMNKDAGFVFQQDPESYTEAVLHSDTMKINLKDSYEPEKRFVSVSPTLGVREGVTIVGEQTVSFSDVLVDFKKPDNIVFYASSNIDIHSKDIVFEDETVNDWYVVCGLWGLIISVPVPMGAMIPENIKGILCAGRALSVEHDIASCVRMKKDMQKCGEAVAEYVVLSLKSDNVNISELQKRLRMTGCLDEKNNSGFVRRLSERERAECSFTTDVAEIEKQLSSDAPGLALWTLRNHPALSDSISHLISDGDEQTRRNTALALGIAGDRRAIPMLLKMAEEPDNTLLKTSDKFVWTRGTSAIYLLGRMGASEACDILERIISGAECGGETYEYGELYVADFEVKSQYILYAMRALISIAEKHRELADRVKNIINAYDEKLAVTLKVNPLGTINLMPKMKEYLKYRLG